MVSGEGFQTARGGKGDIERRIGNKAKRFFFFSVSTSPERECISGQFSNAADDRDCRLNVLLMYILPHLIKAFFQAVWCTCVCVCVCVCRGGALHRH